MASRGAHSERVPVPNSDMKFCASLATSCYQLHDLEGPQLPMSDPKENTHRHCHKTWISWTHPRLLKIRRFVEAWKPRKFKIRPLA